MSLLMSCGILWLCQLAEDANINVVLVPDLICAEVLLGQDGPAAHRGHVAKKKLRIFERKLD